MQVGTQVQVSESKKIIAAVRCWMDDFCVCVASGDWAPL